MDIYDTIGSDYALNRSADIGVLDIIKYTKSISAKSVLDLGCGNGMPIAVNVEPLVEKYVGVDSSKILLNEFIESVPNAEALHSKIEKLDLQNRLFDLIFSFGCLFHLKPKNQCEALKIAASHVSEDGKLIFTSGIEEGECNGYVGKYTIPHWSLGEKKYKELLESCGLKFEGIEVGAGENTFFVFSK